MCDINNTGLFCLSGVLHANLKLCEKKKCNSSGQAHLILNNLWPG